MIINHFNTFPYGGAATAGLRLHAEYLKQGLDSKFFYAQKDREPDSNAPVDEIRWQSPSRLSSRLSARLSKPFEKRRIRRIHRMYDQHLANRDASLELFSMAEQVQRKRVVPHEFSGGIVHLHWIAFMSDLQSLLQSLPNQTPIVWTLHDMNPMSGGCHYSGGCQRFKTGCGACPQLRKSAPADLSSHNLRIKARALRSKKLAIVSPSQWLLDLAKASPIFPVGTTFQHIRLGFDLQEFRPEDQKAARRRLGIDPEVPLVGFGAESVANRRKGLDLLLPALARLKEAAKLEAAFFGSGDVDESRLDLPRTHRLGYISTPQQKRDFYSACDVIVVPSREDNQPQVGLEAMACGTPVVAFDVGGISEYVKPGVTGWLAEPECSIDLAMQIEKLLADASARQKMAEQGHQQMIRDFDIAKQANEYVELYSRLLTAGSNRRSA